MSEQKKGGEAAAGEGGVKRRHFVYHVDEKTNRLLKIEEVDQTTGEATEVDVQFGLNQSGETPRAASVRANARDETAAPQGGGAYPPPGPYGYGAYPSWPPFWPFGVFWVPMFFPYPPPYPAPHAGGHPQGVGQPGPAASAGAFAASDTPSEGPGAVSFEPEGPIVKARTPSFEPEGPIIKSKAVTFEPEGPIIKSKALTFEPEGPIIKSKAAKFEAEGPGSKSDPAVFKADDSEEPEGPNVKHKPADLKDGPPKDK